jgi:D-lactate dehydrogenase (cytochrome)
MISAARVRARTPLCAIRAQPPSTRASPVSRAFTLQRAASTTASSAQGARTSPFVVVASALAGVAATLGATALYSRASEPPAAASGVAPTHSVPEYGTPEDFKNAIAELRAALPEDMVTDDEEDLQQHGFSANDYHPGVDRCLPCRATVKLTSLTTGQLHSVVVFPRSTEDVVKVVKTATKYRMPIIPYSGGTSLEGHTRGVRDSCR